MIRRHRSLTAQIQEVLIRRGRAITTDRKRGHCPNWAVDWQHAPPQSASQPSSPPSKRHPPPVTRADLAISHVRNRAVGQSPARQTTRPRKQPFPQLRIRSNCPKPTWPSPVLPRLAHYSPNPSSLAQCARGLNLHASCFSENSSPETAADLWNAIDCI